MTLTVVTVHIGILLVMPFALIGVINRTKAWWGGRKGPGLTQSFWDMRRLAGGVSAGRRRGRVPLASLGRDRAGGGWITRG